MAKNKPAVRRRSSPRWGVKTLVLTFAFVTAMVVLGVYQVWQRYELYSLGMDLSGETLRYQALLDDGKKLRLERATLKRAERIRQEAIDRLQMRMPGPKDVVEIR